MTLAAALIALLSAALPQGVGHPSDPASADTSRSVWHRGGSELRWTDLDGTTWDAERLHGRVVVLDFWATWCAPCLAEIPHLRRLHDELSADGLLVLGVVLDAIDRRSLRAFLGRHDVTWPQIHQPRATSGPIARRFGVDTVPTVLVVDRRARVVARDLRGPALREVVETLLEFDPGRGP